MGNYNNVNSTAQWENAAHSVAKLGLKLGYLGVCSCSFGFYNILFGMMFLI